MSFKIVVDSCCDLTPQMRKDPCFVKVPLSIHANGSVFVDDDTMDQADLLWSMRQSEDAPSTACPSPQAYLDAYQGEEGEDVYVVTLSALLSGSHNSAEQARVLMEEEQPERNIHVFNSCSASSGEVLAAAGLGLLAGVILHNLLGYGLGYAVAALVRFPVASRRAVSVEVGMQNSGLASGLAAQYFSPEAALPGAIFSVWHNISGGILASIWGRRRPDAESAAEPARR